MSEVYAHAEGAAYIWTGDASASGNAISFVENVSVVMQRQWANDPDLSGGYRDHLISERANISLGQLYVHGTDLQALHDAATAVHFKFLHSNGLGSGGIHIWSGRIDNLTLQGAEAGVYRYALAGHANRWSGF